jgi:acyl-CoA synthetase (AMP-forming)/AMP-acid ligase II
VLGTRGDDIILNVLPLSFDYGLYQVIMAFMCGATLVIEKSFLYPRRTMDLIEQEKVSVFPIVPSIAAILLQTQDFRNCNLSSLRIMTSTAAPLPVEHLRRIREYLPHIRFFSMYGLTECKRVSCLPPEELDSRPSSVGIPIPGCQVFVVDEEGNEVAAGEVGELVVRGPNVMKGYWNAPELTARTFRQGGLPGERSLYSGDLFRRDSEGFLYFVARRDELIKSRGERVSPKEVEDTLCEINGVVEAAVVGVPDDILGQAIVAFVVRVSDSGITEKAILKYCADHLESFMVPRYVRFVNALPRAATGKVDRMSVRETLRESSKP